MALLALLALWPPLHQLFIGMTHVVLLGRCDIDRVPNFMLLSKGVKLIRAGAARGYTGKDWQCMAVSTPSIAGGLVGTLLTLLTIMTLLIHYPSRVG